jgi:hypothetical protein
MLTFELGLDSNTCSEGLGFNHFCLWSPCNPFIEDYTQVLYMNDKGDILSIQYKVSLRGPRLTCLVHVCYIAFGQTT